ncbi:hypothetical protein AMS68_005327 [Peltaster fructicola]|uniref:Xylanolytic transcriptional activator regulatory domain-containing protein n=1 Tax=Peltaster fructicola TaxID=286661 RepID=A0A6H0XZH5_9PEZI|nr:hypothetical protein AMS68_005327 [Peltaster fructicola]
MRRAAQCLRRSNYLEPTEDTVGAMLMYLACEHPYAWQYGAFGASVVLGLVTRSALRLGYHRDPSHYPNMSIFEGEIRRRTWWFLFQLDQLLAVKSGLPRLIDRGKTDTTLPQNLLDEDLDPAMLSLPTPRSMDQPTPVSFMNHKAALLEVMGSMSSAMSHEDVLQLDTILSDTATQRPAWLNTQNVLGDVPAVVLVSAVEVDLIEQSARMQLHRRFLLPAHNDERYAFSRQRCIESAERAIYLQSLLIQDHRGQVGEAKHNWRFIALVGHDFLTAAMLLCLDLDHALKSKSLFTPGLEHLDPSEWQRREELIRQARDMWSAIGVYDDSGQQAANILTVLLRRFEAARSSSQEGPDVEGMQSHNIETSFPQPQGLDAGGYTIWPEMEDMLQFQPMLDGSQINMDWESWASGFAASTNDFGIDL